MMDVDDSQFKLIPVLEKTSDGLVTPMQLRQTTLPLAMISLIMVAAIIVTIGAFMSLAMRWVETDKPALWSLGFVSLAIAIGLAFAYTSINRFQ